METIPKIELGAPAVNVHARVAVDEDRWLLWAHGPRWGPAVLLWMRLVLLVALSLMLGSSNKLSGAPIKRWEWAVLALGLTQVSPLWLLPFALGMLLLLIKPGPAQLSKWLYVPMQLAIAGVWLVALLGLYLAIHANLLDPLDVQVHGVRSGNTALEWYLDQVPSAVPDLGTIALPLWVWRASMLVWSLWLVRKLLAWGPWAWRALRGPASLEPAKAGEGPQPQEGDAPK